MHDRTLDGGMTCRSCCGGIFLPFDNDGVPLEIRPNLSFCRGSGLTFWPFTLFSPVLLHHSLILDFIQNVRGYLTAGGDELWLVLAHTSAGSLKTPYLLLKPVWGDDEAHNYNTYHVCHEGKNEKRGADGEACVPLRLGVWEPPLL